VYSDAHFSTKYWSVVAASQATEAVERTRLKLAIKTMRVNRRIVK
jgi:hypothetical protein